MPDETIHVPDNVVKFLSDCSDEVGKFKGEIFDQDTWRFIQEHSIKSPIEQLLYCALRTLQELNFIEDAEPVEITGDMRVLGLIIQPQAEIGRYRVDFVISHGTGDAQRQLVVECDSQEWHERSEKERRYEKARDRFLLAKGYKVYHYTGKEIVDDPLTIAREILSHVTGQAEDELIMSADY